MPSPLYDVTFFSSQASLARTSLHLQVMQTRVSKCVWAAWLLCPDRLGMPKACSFTKRGKFWQMFFASPQPFCQINCYAVDNIIETMLIDQKKSRQLVDRRLPVKYIGLAPAAPCAFSASALSTGSPPHISGCEHHNCSLL